MLTTDRKTPLIPFIFLAILACSLPVTALAEEPGDDPELAEGPDEKTDSAVELEQIVVTGSHIQRKNLVSSSPVTSVGADELLYQGTVRVEDMVRTLPQVFSSQNTSQSNGATGTATLDLRDLGAGRTLVLINGRRMPVGSPIQGGLSPDINQIPSALVESVEVLTGGASVTYGSDAVAGVVNFLMKKDFEGVQLDYQFSQYSHHNDSRKWQGIVGEAGYPFAKGTENDGDTSSVSLIVGTNFDSGRGNATAYATWRDVEAVWQRDRDYSSCALSEDRQSCLGSGTTATGLFSDFGVMGEYTEPVDFTVRGHEFVPREGQLYNFGPANYYQRPDEQYTLGAFAHYDLSERTQVYTELMYMDNQTLAQIAPSGTFFHPETLDCGHPFMSEQQFQAVCGVIGRTRDDVLDPFWIGRRNVEGGNRQHDLEHRSLRGVLGMKGVLNDDWSYDASLLYSEVRMDNTYLNDLSVTKMNRALDAVRDPATGEIVCRSALDGTDPACVPWNIFEEGEITQEALEYIVLPLSASGSTDQLVASGILFGDLEKYGWRMPAAQTSIAIALGAEFRDENLNFNPDEAYRSGDGAGQGGATLPVSGGNQVSEVFMEANVPLIEAHPFAEELSLDIGLRYSDYEYGGSVESYGLRSGWAVNRDFKLRGSFQRAIRAPNVRELFQAEGFNLFSMDEDPCSGGLDDNGLTNSGRSFEECARSGVTQEDWGRVPDNPASQYNFLQGGNTDLEPESSDTWTFGIVFSPQAIDGLSVSLDYYSIEIEKGIATLTPEFILTECLDGNLGLCQRINRGRAGDLWLGSDTQASGHIVARQDNLAIEKVVGYDLIADYSLGLGTWGQLDVRNVLSLIDKWEQQEIAGAPREDCAGKWGSVCGSPTPDIRNQMRLTWTTPWALTATLMWRHIGEADDLNEVGSDLKDIDYFDLSGLWQVNDGLQLRAGINNLFDREPPVAGDNAGPDNQGNGNTFPGLYDALGRYGFVAVSLSF